MLIQKFPSVWPAYWNNKWPKRAVSYMTKTGGKTIDVRSVLDSSCPEIVEAGQKVKGASMDEKALNCLRLVIKRINYVSDSKKHLKPEFWQEAPETWASQSGDCEDGAILLMKLMEAAGIPAWRRKLCCGFVKSSSGGMSGHAYVIYLHDSFQWMVLDWCYWPLESICAFGKQPHDKRTDKYLDIWWSFNEEYCWSQKNVILGGE